MKWQDRISIKADVCHGKACIKGRRVMVSVILASLAEGDSSETIMANYHLVPEDIQAAISTQCWGRHPQSGWKNLR